MEAHAINDQQRHLRVDAQSDVLSDGYISGGPRHRIGASVDGAVRTRVHERGAAHGHHAGRKLPRGKNLPRTTLSTTSKSDGGYSSGSGLNKALPNSSEQLQLFFYSRIINRATHGLASP